MTISNKCLICETHLFTQDRRYKYCGKECRKAASEISRTKYRSKPEIQAHMKEYARKNYVENSLRLI